MGLLSTAVVGFGNGFYIRAAGDFVAGIELGEEFEFVANSIVKIKKCEV
jgi:hypothetical protein